MISTKKFIVSMLDFEENIDYLRSCCSKEEKQSMKTIKTIVAMTRKVAMHLELFSLSMCENWMLFLKIFQRMMVSCVIPFSFILIGFNGLSVTFREN